MPISLIARIDFVTPAVYEETLKRFTLPLVAFEAWKSICIAASNLIPEIHHAETKTSTYGLTLLAGLALEWAFRMLISG